MSAREDKYIDDNFDKLGWVKFPYSFPEACLSKLEKLGVHGGVGKRLSDMKAISDLLPTEFKVLMAEFGFASSPIRAIWFHKDASKKWSLPWHQDRVITMETKTDDPRLKNWTMKNGQWHCEPDIQHLTRLAFLHIAFDPMTPESGQLQLLEKSHLQGKIKQSDIAGLINQHDITTPDLSRGEALFASTLLLHRSSSNQSDCPRRALRLDFERR